ncbi:hypothetical protein D3C87_1962930 [compost metagenome]
MIGEKFVVDIIGLQFTKAHTWRKRELVDDGALNMMIEHNFSIAREDSLVAILL